MAHRQGTQGMMQVDYEQRMDFNRMREYRVDRIKHYMDEFEVECLLLFDTGNKRYSTSTAVCSPEIDNMGRINLSRKLLLSDEQNEADAALIAAAPPPPPRDGGGRGGPGGGGGRGGFRGGDRGGGGGRRQRSDGFGSSRPSNRPGPGQN